MSSEEPGIIPEEDLEETTTPPTQPGAKAKLDSYKYICSKLGLIMCVYFACRIICGFILSLVSEMSVEIGQTATYVVTMAITVTLVYIVPLFVTAIVFGSFSFYGGGSGKFKELYKRPRRLARAFGTFPAIYGFGYGVALLTLLVSFLISRVTGGQTFIEDLFRPTMMEPSTSMAGAMILVFLMVIVAPIFEELLVRGIMYDALKPYGCGMAIIISSILFGLMHGSLYMLFYTTAIGFALGYVRYATNSLFVVTIIHAIINAVAAGLLFVSSMSDITRGAIRMINTMFSLYTLAMLVLIVVGLIAFVLKIPIIRKYKIENEWSEISPGKKTALFFASVPVIVMMVFAFNELTHNWLLSLIGI